MCFCTSIRLPNHDFAAHSPINFAASSPPLPVDWVMPPTVVEEPGGQCTKIKYSELQNHDTVLCLYNDKKRKKQSNIA